MFKIIKHEKMENITNEKIIAKIEKVLKQIDPNSKKTITQLAENEQFKKNIESIKEYVETYEEKENFPEDVYDKVEELVEFCDSQYKEIAKNKTELKKQMKKNKELAVTLNEVYLFAITREDFSEYEKDLKANGLGDYIDKLRLVSQTDRKSEEYTQCEKDIKSKITNLETNFHIEIDLERIEDKEKVLSYISIELDNVLAKVSVQKEVNVEIEETAEQYEEIAQEEYVADESTYAQYQEDIMIEVKETFFQRLANKFVKGLREFFGISDVPQLIEGTTETNNIEAE